MKTIIFSLMACLPLLAGAQITNNSFENWTSQTVDPSRIYPTGWPLLNDEYHFRSTDAYEGNFSLKVSVWYYYVKTVATQRAAIHTRPATFNGYYKYTDALLKITGMSDIVADTALVTVYMTKWNSTSLRRDTIGSGQIPLTETAVYTLFSCHIAYAAADNPDSISIILDPSKVRRTDAEPRFQSIGSKQECSFFTVDMLSFSATTANEIIPQKEPVIAIFPNPATNHISIKGTKANDAITIQSVDGKKMYEATMSLNSGSIDVSGFPPGIYIAAITTGNGNTIRKRFTKK
jgi:hypothetical protein